MVNLYLIYQNLVMVNDFNSFYILVRRLNRKSIEIKFFFNLIYATNQRGGLMDKTFGLSGGRSVVRIPSRDKFSLKTIPVDARVKYSLSLYYSS